MRRLALAEAAKLKAERAVEVARTQARQVVNMHRAAQRQPFLRAFLDRLDDAAEAVRALNEYDLRTLELGGMRPEVPMSMLLPNPSDGGATHVDFLRTRYGIER